MTPPACTRYLLVPSCLTARLSFGRVLKFVNCLRNLLKYRGNFLDKVYQFSSVPQEDELLDLDIIGFRYYS